MPLVKMRKLFRDGNVCVFGLRGTGKDVLFGNIIARDKYKHVHGKWSHKPYASNLDYGGRYIPLDFSAIDLGENTYKDFLSGSVKQFAFKYPMETDIYISDAGVYFPAQNCNELNVKYPHLPAYFALSRQVSHNNVHVNMQALHRVWDKIREQSNTYVLCHKCVFLPFRIVFMRVTVYDKYKAADEQVAPFTLKASIFDKPEVKEAIKLEREKFRQSYGNVTDRVLVFRNRSKHDTYYFERLLRNGKPHKNEEEIKKPSR